MAISSAKAIKSLASANRRPNPVGGENKVKRITFTKAANGGLMSETHGDHGDGPYREPEMNVHSSISHAAKHMRDKFGDGDK